MITSQHTLNPIQLHLLEMFRHCDSDNMIEELKDVLADFYARKVQTEADHMWDETLAHPIQRGIMRRIVLDTNCLLAVLPSQSPYHNVWTDFIEGQLELCVSNEILSEYEEVLSIKTNPAFAEAIIKTLINKRNLIRITPTWRFRLIESDPDDNKFVDCAICGQSELIVSNDKHFDILKSINFPYVKVMRIQEYVLL